LINRFKTLLEEVLYIVIDYDDRKFQTGTTNIQFHYG
jgi:hypothetical protein